MNINVHNFFIDADGLEEGHKLTICRLAIVLYAIINFAPFVLIQFDFTNAHVDNYNAICGGCFCSGKSFSLGFRVCWGVA